MNIDFAVARTKHLSCRFRLRYILNDRRGAHDRERIASPHHCDLGRWLYADGLERYGDHEAMRALTSVHAEMHAVVARIVAAREGGDLLAAEDGVHAVARLSDEVVRLLESIDDAR